MKRRMTAYLGWSRNTPIECEIEDCGIGAGRTTCFECSGDGDWTKYHPENIPCKCVECKGAGYVYVSI